MPSRCSRYFHHHDPSTDDETKELLRQFEKKLEQGAEHVKDIPKYHKECNSFGPPGGAGREAEAGDAEDGPDGTDT